jgi:glycosyltransferase involved in cell wall biosynthesis
MKKVLVITYYWPPSGGSGVQRWLKFTKYLPDLGWQLFVFTPENPSFEVRDQSLKADISSEVEVIKLPIWEPYSLIERFKGKGSQQSDLVKKKKKSLISKALLWLRGNLFIPDPRIFWVKPAVKVLEDLIAANGIDLIITTGPPHSMHLIGLKLKKKTGIKWLADFRDPWSKWDLFDSFYLSVMAKRKHKALEKRVLKAADAVISVSKHYAAELAQIGARNVEVVTNGFDEEEFLAVPDQPIDEFIIRHIGVVDELRDPRPCLYALRTLAEEGNSYKIEFIGNVNQALKEEVLNDPVLKELVSFGPYVPHSEVVKIYKSSAVLLLVLANSQNAPGNIPGKLFEYLASGRPVLAIGSTTGDSAGIIHDAGAGVVCEYSDVQGIKRAIKQLHQEFVAGRSTESRQIGRFSRRALTKRLSEILNSI